MRESDPVSGIDYWQAGSVNARGQLTADTLGGVWATSWSYHARSGQLLGINHVAPAAQRQLDYRYDVFGNLRQQALNGGQSVEDYAYDDLHRLTQATRSGATNSSVSYGYDAVGNFRWKSDFSTMAGNAYGYSGSCGGGPNAVKRVQTAAGTRSYCYDANGNLTGDSAGLAVAYDHANLPVKTTRGTATIQFAYGPDGQRTRQWGAGGTRIYVSGYEDLPTTGETKTYVGDYAVITRTETTRSVRYLLKDRLGSVDAVGDEAGNLIETRGYDAFGKPRSGDWHDLAPPRLQTSGTTPKGFTQHEHLDAVELIHMNGRAFDYQLGRFLGVDPFIQFPLNSQSLNPYSYILNNPLSGTDPTGYQSCRVESGKCHMLPKEGEVKRMVETPTGSRIGRTVATVAGLPGGGVAISFGPNSGRAIAGFLANGAKTQGAMTAARADGVDPATKGGLQQKPQLENGAAPRGLSESNGSDIGRSALSADERDSFAQQAAYVRDTAIAFELPPLPNWLVDGAAGFGDTLSFGATKWARDSWDIGSVDYSSGSYTTGQVAGVGYGIALGGVGGLSGGARSVFWSGSGNMERAAAMGRSLEATPIGSLMNRFGSRIPHWGWKAASCVYACNASGTAIKVGMQQGNVWRTIEQPILNWRGIPYNIVP